MGRSEKSTIVFFVVCQRVLPFVKCMEIDNGKNHMLTNYIHTIGEGRTVNSDHLPLKMNVDLQAFPCKKEKKEMLNFKDEEGQNIFRDITTNTSSFTDCFTNEHKVSKEAEEWMTVLKTHAKKSFKTIRIQPRKIKPSEADKLITHRNRLVIEHKVKEAQQLNVKIATIISKESRKKAFMFKKFTDISSSGCLSEMWKTKNSLFPKKAHTLPSAKLNYAGRIVSEPQEITKLLGEEYGKFRLRKRPTHPKYEWLKTMRNKALNLKLKVALKKLQSSLPCMS